MKSLLGRAKECLLVFYYTRILGLRKIYTFNSQKFVKDDTAVFRFVFWLKNRFIFCELGHPTVILLNNSERKQRLYSIDVNQVCCSLNSFKFYVVNNNEVMAFAKVKILDTPNGKLLAKMMEDPRFELTFAPRMTKNLADGYTGIITFDVVNPGN